MWNYQVVPSWPLKSLAAVWRKDESHCCVQNDCYLNLSERKQNFKVGDMSAVGDQGFKISSSTALKEALTFLSFEL